MPSTYFPCPWSASVENYYPHSFSQMQPLQIARNLLNFACIALLSACATTVQSERKITKLTTHDRSVETLMRWAENEDPGATFQLCYRYRQGDRVPQDHVLAHKWCSASANQGMSTAQVFLADMYWNGWGVQTDKNRALSLYQAAANENDDGAEWILSKLYRDGDHVSSDSKLSEQYLRRAADHGHSKAIAELRKIDPHYLSPARFPQADPARNERFERIKLDVEDGKIETRSYKFLSDTIWTISVNLKPASTRQMWKPVQLICFSLEKPSESACLALILEGETLQVAWKRIAANERELIEERLIKQLKFPDGNLILYVSFVDNSLRFTINNEDKFIEVIRFKPEVLGIACSSAHCDTALNIST